MRRRQMVLTIIVARMPEQGRHPMYGFGRWELDLARRELRTRGVTVSLGRREVNDGRFRYPE
jgi:hypothetical protein